MQSEFASTFRNLPRPCCFLCGYGDSGWPGILAHSPADRFVGRRLVDLVSLKQFIGEQWNKRRLVVGYFSFEIGCQLHGVPPAPKDDLRLPDAYLLAFDRHEMLPAINPPSTMPSETPILQTSDVTSSMSEQDYGRAFERIKKYITAGHIYQINLTHRLQLETRESPRELFLRLAAGNPVEHLAYIEGDGFEVLSASPERFIRIRGRDIETMPIKGTRPRGATPPKDAACREELLASEKEAAELDMITDLLRNDLGKVCEVGSVRVEGRRLVRACPSVWHTYSHIKGRLVDGVTSLDALLLMLPGGSISGCPKKRALEIIRELEPTVRGVYTGCVGYWLPDGTCDFNIAIRTLIKKDRRVYLSVGGGVVYDSQLAAEYRETFDKAESLLSVVANGGW